MRSTWFPLLRIELHYTQLIGHIHKKFADTGIFRVFIDIVGIVIPPVAVEVPFFTIECEDAAVDIEVEAAWCDGFLFDFAPLDRRG